MRPKVTIAREQFDAVILHMEGVVIQTAKVQATGGHRDKTLVVVTGRRAGGPAALLPPTHHAIAPVQPADRSR